MKNTNKHPFQFFLPLAVLLATLAGCGGGGGGGNDGPAIEARPQSIVFDGVNQLPLGGTASFRATASSGLEVRYASYSSSVCSVDSSTGLATAIRPGDCKITATQDGNSTYAPARATLIKRVYVDPDQTISFAAAPSNLNPGGYGKVSATASSGLAVAYSSLTNTVCSVDASTGTVTGLIAGTCEIDAYQAGTTDYPVYNAKHATQVFNIQALGGGGTVPGKPSGVSATFGASVNQVVVSVGAVSPGGSPITGFKVTSVPAGVTASATHFPITVTCPGSCVGYAFSVQATNVLGDGPASDPADVITAYNIKTTWYEPATQPNDSIFTGSFVFNSTTKTVTELKGDLTQSMTTDDSDPACATIAGCPGGYGKIPMTTVFAQYQLKSEAVTLGGMSGLLVTTFVLNTTNTFYHVGGDGWSPAWGVEVGGIYYGWPTAKNPASGGVGNSSAMVFINTADPMTPLTSAQINWTAYADCSPGGMMGAVCMTGTAKSIYGAPGTMGGIPHSQVITRK